MILTLATTDSLDSIKGFGINGVDSRPFPPEADGFYRWTYTSTPSVEFVFCVLLDYGDSIESGRGIVRDGKPSGGTWCTVPLSPKGEIPLTTVKWNQR
jgi:hypothetical protein